MCTWDLQAILNKCHREIIGFVISTFVNGDNEILSHRINKIIIIEEIS